MKQSNKAKLESMLGAVERKRPATKPSRATCTAAAYCAP
ncbi:hypothetical protein Snas_2455 [Stackebrandtia nassauensis DSM 44728]|uniref:Uncharacterized protein n=1 Tax=Stackebrandtia nassauensis (strain DSM 44728 / CIP 108903 / NRRL B-16338 / NBRC 102104 / LLR-40K-21) TaxID=446470 RepID=D3Q4V8_STANL|nr:hypothetical protein Snas_2455 [Stackebrandtia nassauensis DSM 44728]